MEAKDIALITAIAKSAGGGGSTGGVVPVPTAEDTGKVPKVNAQGEYELAIDEGQNTFAGLTDTNISSPSSGQFVTFGSGNKWVNQTVNFKNVVSLSNTVVNVPVGTYTGYATNKSSGQAIIAYDNNYYFAVGADIRVQAADTKAYFARFYVANGIHYLDVLTAAYKTALSTQFTLTTMQLDDLVVSGTLTAGQTSITLSNTGITSNSLIEVFTSTGVAYTGITVSSGSVTLTYPEQSADISVKVRVS